MPAVVPWTGTSVASCPGSPRKGLYGMGWLKAVALSSPRLVMNWPRGLIGGLAVFILAALTLGTLGAPIGFDLIVGVVAAAVAGRARIVLGATQMAPPRPAVSALRIRCEQCGVEATLMAAHGEGYRLQCGRCRTDGF